MIKKLFAFQQLLFCSEPFRTQGAKSPNSAITWIYIFLVVGSFILFTPIFSGEFTAVSFIKKKKLRIFAIACFSVLFYLSLLLLKFHITAISTTGYTNFVNDFQKLPNAHFILFCLGVFFIIIAPVSIFAGQWFYKCRFKI
jgi:hypothetical protein